MSRSVYTVALGERDFDSSSLLPGGEGLGMRAVHPGIQQRHPGRFLSPSSLTSLRDARSPKRDRATRPFLAAPTNLLNQPAQQNPATPPPTPPIGSLIDLGFEPVFRRIVSQTCDPADAKLKLFAPAQCPAYVLALPGTVIIRAFSGHIRNK